MLLSLALVVLAPAAPPAGGGAFLAVGAASAVPVRGELVRLGPDGADLRSGTALSHASDLLSLRRVGVPLPPWPHAPMLLTAAGDRVPGQLVGGDAESLAFRPAPAGTGPAREWKVPFSAAAAVWLVAPPADTPADPARYAWRGDARRDALLFRNGDALRGTLEGFMAGGGLSFKPPVGETREIPLARLAAVAFNPALSRARKPKGPYARLVLRDGTRIDLVGAACDGKAVVGKTRFGSPFEVGAGEVLALDVRQGKAVYLCDLAPARAEQADFLGVHGPATRDRDARGEPFRLATADGDSTVDRGFACRPRSRIAYALDGKYRRFEAAVGLDAAIREGSAVVRVEVDGKEGLGAAAGRLTPGRSQRLVIDVAGAKELTLVVDFGPSGGVGAEVVWDDARLVE